MWALGQDKSCGRGFHFFVNHRLKLTLRPTSHAKDGGGHRYESMCLLPFIDAEVKKFARQLRFRKRLLVTADCLFEKQRRVLEKQTAGLTASCAMSLNTKLGRPPRMPMATPSPPHSLVQPCDHLIRWCA